MKDQKFHSEIAKIPVASVIVDGGRNPRNTFDEDKLFDLGNSISETTQLQPIIVNEIDGKYHLVAGERRLRSAKDSDQELIEAKIFKELEPIDTLIMSLDENHQRVHLNVIEEAGGMKQLLDHGKSEEWIAERYGYKTKEIVRQRLSLLTLPNEIQKAMTREHNALPIKQALLLLNLPHSNKIQLAREIAPKTGPVMGMEVAKELIDNSMGKKLPGMESLEPVDRKKKKSPFQSVDDIPEEQQGQVPRIEPLGKSKAKKVKPAKNLKPISGVVGIDGKIVVREADGNIVMTKATITVKVGDSVEILNQDELYLGLDMVADNNNRDKVVKLVKKALRKAEKLKKKKATTKKKVSKKKTAKKKISKK